MSDGQQDVAAQPLVIIRRRRGSNEEAHHGGVWKIAYADFMTAMMAFFLVMWLVNAADKKTIVQVAAYFNPVRLTEKSLLSKGVEDPTNAEHKKPEKNRKDVPETPPDGPEAIESEEETAKDSASEIIDKVAPAPSSAAVQAAKEEALFTDPMGVLDNLASKAPVPEIAKEISKPDVSNAAVRDPFNPAHRSAPETYQPVAPKNEAAKPSPTPTEAAKDLKPKASAKVPPPAPDAPSNDANDSATAADASKLNSEIQNALAQLGESVPNADVKATSEGLLVSLTDSPEFGMFAVGSAEPRPELVVAIAKVAGILKSREGRIVVRGHTDGRAYRGGNYDNWRLSAARAQMSYHMLVRGGIDQEKFIGIEGRADRDLKVPDDKTAAQNRRIEILIKSPKT